MFWSFGYVLTRLALQHFSAFSLGFLRYFMASCTLAAIAVITRMKLPDKKDWPLFVLSGGLGFFLYMITFNHGSQTVTAATASVIIAVTPVLTALLARLLYRERLFAYQWVAIVIEFAGILILMLLDNIITVNMGIVWLLLAAAVLSGYNLLQRKLINRYSSLQVCASGMFAGTLLLSVFAPASVGEIAAAPLIQYVIIAGLGIFSSAVAFLFWSKAFEKAANTAYVSNYMFLTPFITALLGIWLAGEAVKVSTLIGGAVILLGVMLFNKQSLLVAVKKQEDKSHAELCD